MKYLILALLMMVSSMSLAQEDLSQEFTFALEDGTTLTLSLPADWIIDSDVAYENHAWLSDNTGLYADLELHNSSDYCGAYSPGVVQYPDCNAPGSILLPYFLDTARGWTTLEMREAFTSPAGESVIFADSVAGMYAGAVALGNANYFIITWFDAPSNEKERLPTMKAVLSSVVFEQQTLTSTDFLPHPEATTQGWALDLTDYAALLRLTFGSDGLFYALLDDGQILVLDEDGNPVRLLDNGLNVGAMDMAVGSDSTIYFATGSPSLIRMDKDGNLLDDWWIDSSNGIIQIETDAAGQIYLLEQGLNTAEVSLWSSDLEEISRFTISSDDFSFAGEAWLSLAAMAISPEGIVYVYNEWNGIIRAFDDGEIVISAIEAKEYVRGFGFTDDGTTHVVLLNSPTINRYTLAGELIDSVELEAYPSTVLSNGDLMIYQAGILHRVTFPK